MREVSSREYATYIQDEIEQTIEVDMFDLFNSLAKTYGFRPQGEFDEFSAVYYDGYAATIREEVIKMFEELGMDVRPDGRSW